MKSESIVTKTSLREAVREVCRLRHLSPRTEDCYWQWIRRFYRFNGGRSLRELGVAEARAFLSHLAVNEHVAASTQIYTHVTGRGACGIRSPFDLPTMGVRVA